MCDILIFIYFNYESFLDCTCRLTWILGLLYFLPLLFNLLLDYFLIFLQSFLDLVVCCTSTLHFKFQLYTFNHLMELYLQSFNWFIYPVRALRIDSSLAYMSWFRMVCEIVSYSPRNSISRFPAICSVIYSKLCLSSPICLSSFMSRSTCFWYSSSKFYLKPIQIRPKLYLPFLLHITEDFFLCRSHFLLDLFPKFKLSLLQIFLARLEGFYCLTHQMQLIQVLHCERI